jgi:hypothetical protein
MNLDDSELADSYANVGNDMLESKIWDAADGTLSFDTSATGRCDMI